MSCVHLQEFKQSCGLESYELIYSSFIMTNNGSSYYKALASCFECEIENHDCRLLACMHCIYFGCHDKHVLSHTSAKSHILFVELSNGQIICYKCQDLIFDPDVDEIIEKNFKKCIEPFYVTWKPTEEDCKILEEHSKRIKIEVGTPFGMRGLINLGNTCFMNCIIQALLHTPMLRDYFFSERHTCYRKKPSDCLFCHFSRLFQKYYTDDDYTPLSLHEILYMLWQNDANFCSYEQKDAHEFFLAARNLLHQFSVPPNINESPCNCIIDSIFKGKLQSDLVCQTCSNASITIDPLWELTLDIPESPDSATLLECLYQFTRREPLGELECHTCKSQQEQIKQFTFKLLPLVLVIHLKRFETVKAKHKKKSLYVSFPIDLDMAPFMAGQRNQHDESYMADSNEVIGPYDSRYSLYAVIVHSGTLDSGHYLSYIRRTTNSWFKCNDAEIEPASVEQVLSSEGYLLFYHKTILTYE